VDIVWIAGLAVLWVAVVALVRGLEWLGRRHGDRP
jgi:hypothetical protein